MCVLTETLWSMGVPSPKAFPSQGHIHGPSSTHWAVSIRNRFSVFQYILLVCREIKGVSHVGDNLRQFTIYGYNRCNRSVTTDGRRSADSGQTFVSVDKCDTWAHAKGEVHRSIAEFPSSRSCMPRSKKYHLTQMKVQWLIDNSMDALN